ncbi:MAG TPA: hypothetical protein VL990_10900 [Acidobacteriaceae bacterium]|nr:hypothetical protein [Acidobacteriaceae bacterium]
MGSIIRKSTRFLIAAVFAASLLSVGCAVRARVYDPYDHDYHAWAAENGYYVQWEHDTHRSHEDFDKRSDADRHAYWEWRHSHDHDQH